MKRADRKSSATLVPRHQIALALVAVGSMTLTGCATVNIEQRLAKVDQDAAAFTQGQLALRRSDAARNAAQSTADQLLEAPLTRDGAVRLALINSADLQAILAEAWSTAATSAQASRIANPVFTFERLSNPVELDYGRLLAFGLFDVLTLPQRLRVANAKLEQQQVETTIAVIDRITQVRYAWTTAVTAEQSLTYAKQVLEAAEASAELARRMQRVGNFNKLQRARQQAYYADAVAQLAIAKQRAVSSREALVRGLGLSDAQAERLKLPDRLPDMPAAPRTPDEVSRTASVNRLDTKLSAAILNAAIPAERLGFFTSLTDIELAGTRNTAVERADGHATRTRGYEIDVRIPLFDFGDLRRQAMSANSLAALNRHEATLRAAGSHLRESYAAYRTTYDIAKHYRDEVVPLRKLINEENVLRYNGMIIGVFELLADTREQIVSVMSAIEAQHQFWLADAALEATIIGKPMSMSVGFVPAASGGGDAPH
jgi:outer membrane protein TolC